MALNGIAIYKLLPQTNCKECGQPTCLAFAMKLAARQTELAACPYVSDEAKALLDNASAPPIRLIALGNNGSKLEVGNETVVFRHEKTFIHQPGLFVRIPLEMTEPEVDDMLQRVVSYQVERVGQKLRLDGVAIEGAPEEPDKFKARVTKAAEKGLAMILVCFDAATTEVGLQAAGAARPLIYAADSDNWQAMAGLAKAHSVPLVVRTPSGDLGQLAALTEQLAKEGVADLVLDPAVRDWAGSLSALTRIRRAAIKKNFRPLGYPVITFPGEEAESAEQEAMLASQAIGKYASLVVLDHFDPAAVYSLLTLRQNIYTDPQKPIQVSPGLYEIGEAGPESPLLVTTNFSLTYFSVAGEVESTGRPAWLLVADSEGMSVLTAWAAGKFDAQGIAKAVKTAGIEDKLKHRQIVIPGAVAGISGELEEELPGWRVLVGPREAIGVPSFLKQIAQG